MGIDYSTGKESMDYRSHENTYNGFIKLSIWTTVLVVLILVGMAATLV